MVEVLHGKLVFVAAEKLACQLVDCGAVQDRVMRGLERRVFDNVVGVEHFAEIGDGVGDGVEVERSSSRNGVSGVRQAACGDPAWIS